MPLWYRFVYGTPSDRAREPKCSMFNARWTTLFLLILTTNLLKLWGTIKSNSMACLPKRLYESQYRTKIVLDLNSR